MRTKELREKLGLTQEGLADKINGRTAWIKQQEREPLCMWTEQQLRLVATALNCTVGELFDAPENEQEPEPVEMPKWAIVYEKLEKMLEPLPFMSIGAKHKVFYSQTNPGQESFLVTQDYVGYISVIDYVSRHVLFLAHPKGGASIFIKGKWLEILDEASS